MRSKRLFEVVKGCVVVADLAETVAADVEGRIAVADPADLAEAAVDAEVRIAVAANIGVASVADPNAAVFAFEKEDVECISFLNLWVARWATRPLAEERLLDEDRRIFGDLRKKELLILLVDWKETASKNASSDTASVSSRRNCAMNVLANLPLREKRYC